LIYGLLLEPDLENPLEIQASLKYCELRRAYVTLALSDAVCHVDDDDGTYALAVANAVVAHAWKTRDQWKKELGVDEWESTTWSD
jgi:hypothetical protein